MKIVPGVLCALILSMGICLSSDAIVCNSPCPNPCSPSRTVCEGTNCTTYCGVNPSYSAAYYTQPAVSFSYSTPNVSFSISNEVYGIYNYYSRPNFTVTNGFRPIYHKVPPKKYHNAPKPAPGVHKHVQVHNIVKPANKNASVNKKPTANQKPAQKHS